MNVQQSTWTQTLGAKLETDRLERRVWEVTAVIAAFRQCEGAHRRDLSEPLRHVRRTIDDFEAQLEAINTRLQELTHESHHVA